jgi:hypothetical protein
VHAASCDEQDRRADAQALLDGAIEQGRVRAQCRIEPFDREQCVEEVAEQLAGRRQATRDEVSRERARLGARKADTVDLELHEPRHDIGAFLAGAQRRFAGVDLRVDVAREFGERVGEALTAVGAVPEWELALHQLLRHAGEVVGVLRREPEQVDSDAVGQRHGVARNEVDGRAGRGLRPHGEQRVRSRAHERFGVVHDFRRQCRHHHPSHATVFGRVELAEDTVLERDHDAGCLHARRVRERVGVAEHRAARIVLCHVRHPAGDRRNRSLGAQLAQQREVVTAAATERIEVGGVAHAGIVANLGRLRVRPARVTSLEVLDDVLRVCNRQAVAFELDA